MLHTTGQPYRAWPSISALARLDDNADAKKIPSEFPLGLDDWKRHSGY